MQFRTRLIDSLKVKRFQAKLDTFLSPLLKKIQNKGRQKNQCTKIQESSWQRKKHCAIGVKMRSFCSSIF